MIERIAQAIYDAGAAQVGSAPPWRMVAPHMQHIYRDAAQAALTAIMGEGDGLEQWECFCDAAYFDMWCVREVGERRFGHGFHLVNGEEARGLCDHLNEQARHRSTAAAAERARIVATLGEWLDNYQDEADHWPVLDDMRDLLAAIERGEV